MLVLIKGAGDLASGVAVRLRHAGFQLTMTDLPKPTAIRRMVSFCRAISNEEAMVEDVRAKLAHSAQEAQRVMQGGDIAVLADPQARCREALRPDVLVDAVLAKRNLGTTLSDAPVVIALGPGFAAGLDCHAVIETMRGHDLGRVLYQGRALENTGVPGNIGGYSSQRLLRAPCAGIFEPLVEIGACVRAGDTVAMVDGIPITAAIDGVIRGLLPAHTPVVSGMKSGDVDPRGVVESCYTVSDKARAIGGGVLEAILHLTEAIGHER
ncbi:MAG: selenium-dependent molybdenum cofactor biosynthesis protein YqeB [Clostridia bacterium]